MIGLDTAGELLDFRGVTRSITADAAEAQLEGAVALHNVLEDKGVAYLADEVGMGKTYVALGTMALFRHFQPDFRLLVLAPRENIQLKWMKELRNFVRNNVRFPDLRVKAVHGAPARPTVSCRNLVELVRETSLNPDRDFFARLTSFSLPLGKNDKGGWGRRRDELLSHLPWADPGLFDLRSREQFKDNFARALCAALPPFDLVIVDEGHNLKHGFGSRVAARNRVLALAFGHPSEKGRGFPGYGPRARRVLFLSATPLENDYQQLWNQLDVFGFGDTAPELISKEASEDEKQACARSFLIRRVTAMTVGEKRLTKNLYRREWRRGGCSLHDEPLALSSTDGDRQRLIVALVQKKVSEVLGHERFNNSFQIGMLASFESFLETAKVKKRGADDDDDVSKKRGADDDDGVSNFDDSDQTDKPEERVGLDVGAVNHLARSYRRRFGRELPHPKMDALVERLGGDLPYGRKALVFVRRVASVKELQAKLEERYDDWLFARLRAELPGLEKPLSRAFGLYRDERAARGRKRVLPEVEPGDSGELEEAGAPALAVPEEDDRGGLDSFFAWFFRGDGPPGFLSGAAFQKRFIRATNEQSTFFEDNYVAWLLGVRPEGKGSVLQALAEYLGEPRRPLTERLVARAERLLPAHRGGRIGRLYLFQALQEAGLAALAEADGTLQGRAQAILQLLNGAYTGKHQGARAPAESEKWLEEPTFFSELRGFDGLRARLWPEPSGEDFREVFREQELRRLLLSATARLGHAFIDLYTVAVSRIGSIESGARGGDDDEDTGSTGLIGAYIQRLETQRSAADASLGAGGKGSVVVSREFAAFDELAALADHFDLIVDVNVPDLRTLPLVKAAPALGTLCGRQRPIGGMFGQINKTVVRQFRLPGYPFVLVTTDLLQEGEDLHTFCSAVYHYGISWMPSSMEQRIGRVDRVNSHAERRLTGLEGDPGGQDKLQVYYPHLRDTVEVLQVHRVLERMDRFIRLMHKDLKQPEARDKRLDVNREINRVLRDPAPITEPLETAFPVRKELLTGSGESLAVPRERTEGMLRRFRGIPDLALGELDIRWETNTPDDLLKGTLWRGGRQQPFWLFLRSMGGRLMLRCFSPIGDVSWGIDLDELGRHVYRMPVQVAVERNERKQTLTLRTEDAILLAAPEQDATRVAWLIDRVTTAADTLEQRLLPGADQPAETFRGRFEEEADRAD